LPKLSPKIYRFALVKIIFINLLIGISGKVSSTPYTPNNPLEILEHLPFKANDPLNQEIKKIRADLLNNPKDPHLAGLLARKYFHLANSEGDPRYIGYALSVIKPWIAIENPPIDIVLVRGLLSQFSHEFGSAIADFKHVLSKDPKNGEAISWLVNLNIVQGYYSEAQRINQFFLNASLIDNKVVYDAVIESILGQTNKSYVKLLKLVRQAPQTSLAFKEWGLIRLAEMAIRLNDLQLAEKHFLEALTIDPQDAYGQAAYADFLLDQQRYREVIERLKNKQASDILLLRLAQAAYISNSSEVKKFISALEDRFNAANLRGDRLHLMEESRFELKIKNNPAKALELAALNWQTQREPKDARCFLEAALAAKNPKDAQAVLQWMRETNYEDPVLRSLEKSIRNLPQ
jgi:Tfp pilus assembly protein PilF